MRVELTDHVADDAGAFLECGVGPYAHFAHGMDDAPVHRLQTVANVGQRAVHDGRQRIGQIALFKRCLEINRDDVVAAVAVGRWCQIFAHGA
jgi:hypothetical protein